MQKKGHLDFSILIFFFFCTLIIFFVSSKFSPLYNFNYWSDINIYYTIGKGIWYDKVIYKDLFDHKGPLIFFIYSLGYFLSPGTFGGMFIVQSCFQCIALFYTYKVLLLFSNKRKISMISSMFIFLFLLSFNLDGGSAEEFIFVFEIVSFYYFMKFFKEKSIPNNPKFMFIHGLMFACVFYIKLNMILFWFFPLLFIYISLLKEKQYRNIYINVLCFLGGVFIVSFLLFLYFFINDALSDFWNAYISFNRLYVNQIGFDFKQICIELYLKIKTNTLIFVLLAIGFLFMLFGKVLNNKLGYIALILSCGLMIIFTVPNSTHLHYYLIPLMPFGVLFLITLVAIADRLLIKDINSPLFFIVLFVSVFYISSIKNLFGYKFNDLYGRNFPLTSVERFSQTISSSNGMDLLVLDISAGICVFTALDIVPDIKYFFHPNISNDLYPDIIDSHIKYMKNKSIKYVIISKRITYLSEYQDVLFLNYDQIDEYINLDGSYSLLYKRR